jgi:hypothetical protein
MTSLSVEIPSYSHGPKRNSPNLIAGNAGLKFHHNIDYSKADNYLFFETKPSPKPVLTPKDNTPMMDDIMS